MCSTCASTVCERLGSLALRETKCAKVIKDEVDSLEKLKKSGVQTVKFYHDEEQEPIGDVTCGQEQAECCSGYLVERVGSAKGRHKHIHDRITFNEVGSAIKDVKGFTGKADTVNNLGNIISYMKQPQKPVLS